MQPDIQNYQDMGDYLREARESKGFDVKSVSDVLNIRERYIEALEKGDLTVLPGKTYVKGYLRNYAEVLGIDKEALVAAFSRLHQESGRPRYFIPRSARKHDKPRATAIMGGVVLMVTAYIYWYGYEQEFVLPPLSAVIQPLPPRLMDTFQVDGTLPQNDDDFMPIINIDGLVDGFLPRLAFVKNAPAPVASVPAQPAEVLPWLKGGQ